MIEEPEAHLHVQVQRIFPDKAHKLISPTDKDASALQSQAGDLAETAGHFRI